MPQAVPVLKTRRLSIRLASREDVPGILDYFGRNRAFFAVTDPDKPADFYSFPFWESQVDRSLQEFHRDQAVRFFLFNEKERVVGTAHFTQLVRGAFQACYLGYGLDEKSQGQGLMTEALEAAIPYVFDTLGLHRIMANYMPQNARSAAVLKRLGFGVEGQAREYLRIGGEWRDHVLTSLVSDRWIERPPARDPARPC